MKTLIVQGRSVLVDDDVYEKVKDLPWHIQKGKGYVMTTVYLHRLIVGAEKGITVDHDNEDKLDNRRQNLKKMSLAENIRKRSHRGGRVKSSRFYGVCWHKHSGRWQAVLSGNYLGLFSQEVDAARAYNEAVRLRGDQGTCVNRV